MKLVSMPTSNWAAQLLTLGKDYAILGYIGNGVVIQSDDSDTTLLILKERLE